MYVCMLKREKAVNSKFKKLGVELNLIYKQFHQRCARIFVVVVKEENQFQALLSFFPLPEAKKTICENLFACLFSTIKCKILLPVSGLCHMSLPITKSACLLMNPIRGKDLERFKDLNFLFNISAKETSGQIWLLCLENRNFVFALKSTQLAGERAGGGEAFEIFLSKCLHLRRALPV